MAKRKVSQRETPQTNKEKDKKIEVLMEDLVSLENYILELFTFTPAPICFISPIGVILEFSPAFEKISEYRFYEVVGEEIGAILGETESKELVAETLGKGGVWAKEMTLLTKTKRRVPVSVFSRARKDEDDKIVGFFVGVFDLTEVKNTQGKLQEKIEELERFRKIAIGRELKMVALKEELRRLKSRPETNN